MACKWRYSILRVSSGFLWGKLRLHSQATIYSLRAGSPRAELLLLRLLSRLLKARWHGWFLLRFFSFWRMRLSGWVTKVLICIALHSLCTAWITPGSTVCENSRDSLSNPRRASQIWEVDSDWLKGHAIHNGLFGLIISNYIDHIMVHPQSYKIYFLEDKLSVYNIRTVYLAS